MKTEQHVSQMGADMALQLMLMTLFRLVADMGDDPDGFLSGVRTALLDCAASYPLPELTAANEVRSICRAVASVQSLGFRAF
jgi:hypothetical protein